jgi:hypothetical protein
LSYGRKEQCEESVHTKVNVLFFSTDVDISAGEDAEAAAATPQPQKVATVEFKLVEDLRLVTIPVTSCLLVLVSILCSSISAE